MKKIKGLILLLAFTVGCSKDEIKIDDFIPGAEQLRWANNSLPITINVPADHSQEKYDALVNAASTWNAALGFVAIIIQRDVQNNESFSLTNDSLSDSKNGIYDQSTWFSDARNKTQTLAIAVYKFISNTIIASDIHFNTEVFFFSVFPDTSGMDYETVALHEMGHFLGLGHNSANTQSVMYPYASIGLRRVVLSQDDIDNIRERYEVDQLTLDPSVSY